MKLKLGGGLLCAALLASGCDKGPCSGGGMTLDSRPLPEDWQAAAPAPSGAVACHEESGATDTEYSRNYELGASPNEGFETFGAHLTAAGWAELPAKVVSEYFLQATFAKDGARLELKVSRNVEDKGWCTVTFTPAGSS